MSPIYQVYSLKCEFENTTYFHLNIPKGATYIEVLQKVIRLFSKRGTKLGNRNSDNTFVRHFQRHGNTNELCLILKKIVLPVTLCTVFFLSLCFNLLSRSLILSSKCIVCFLVRSAFIAISLKNKLHILFLYCYNRFLLNVLLSLISCYSLEGCAICRPFVGKKHPCADIWFNGQYRKVLPTSFFSMHHWWKSAVTTCIRVFRQLFQTTRICDCFLEHFKHFHNYIEPHRTFSILCQCPSFMYHAQFDLFLIYSALILYIEIYV